MKRILLLAGLVVSMFLSTVYAQGEKIGYVDVAKLFDEYQKTKDFDKNLETKIDAYDKERENKVQDVKQFQEKLNILNDKEKEAKQKELEDKIKSVREFTMSKEDEIRKERDVKFKEILDDIEKAVKQYAVQSGYTLIMNSKVFVYTDGKNDITSETAKILQSTYKK